MRGRFYDYFYITVGFVWLVFVLGFPRAYQSVKIIGLALMCLVAFIEALLKRRKIKTELILAVLGFILVYSASLAYGILSGYKFEREDYVLIQYYVITPVCVLIISTIFKERYRLEVLKRVIIILAFSISAYNVMYILSIIGAIPAFSMLRYGIVASAVISDSFMTLRMSNEAAVMFLLPYIIVLSLDTEEYERVYRILIYAGIVLGCFYAAFSGRRALELVVILSFAYILRYIKRGRLKKHFKIIVPAMLGSAVLILALGAAARHIGLDNIFETVRSSFLIGFTDRNLGLVKRQGNFEALLLGWLSGAKSVFFGHGLNSYVSYSLATSSGNLWSYEIYYNALLYQTGLVGFFMLAYICAGIIKSLNKKIKGGEATGSYTAMKVAFIMFLLACASNPMINNVAIWSLVVSFIV